MYFKLFGKDDSKQYERYKASLLVPDFFVWQLMQFLLYCHILSPFLHLTTVLDVPEAGWNAKKNSKEKKDNVTIFLHELSHI